MSDFRKWGSATGADHWTAIPSRSLPGFDWPWLTTSNPRMRQTWARLGRLVDPARALETMFQALDHVLHHELDLPERW